MRRDRFCSTYFVAMPCLWTLSAILFFLRSFSLVHLNPTSDISPQSSSSPTRRPQIGVINNIRLPPGHIQFITYFGRAPIRAGEKLGRDIQTSTFPKENSMPLNTTQMPKRAMGSLSLGGDPLKALQAVQQAASAQGTEASGAEGATGSDHHPLPGGTTGSDSAAPLSRTVSVAGGGPTEYQLQVANEYLRKQRGHKEYLTTLKGVANTAKHRGFHENPYRYKDTLLRRNADLLKVGDGMRRTVSGRTSSCILRDG